MKKIMFSERYGLEQAVLAGTKSMTRRIIKGNFEDVKVYHANGGWHFIADTDEGDSVELKPQYEIGERVAIAQRYEDAINPLDWVNRKLYQDEKGWSNKMYVKADLMPHRIRITNIKVERLQDISEEDCLREGLLAGEQEPRMYGFRLPKGTVLSFLTPREAFASLIDRISGRGTWQSNPWVYAYTFELIK